MSKLPPLIAHVVYRFDIGGLENGVVNLINRMPADRYRHAIISLTDVTDFRQRVQVDGVQFIALNKPPGHGVKVYPQLYRCFKQLRPAIVHTRNLAALEAQVPAWLAGVRGRVHGEHGRDVNDMDGSSVRYQRVRKLYRPFVQRYVALSRDLSDYLIEKINVDQQRVTQIYNGVDTEKFSARLPANPAARGPFADASYWVVGTVGRMAPIKDHVMLTKAFIRAIALNPELKSTLRLTIIGDGPEHERCCALLREAGLSELAWLPGARSDVSELMHGFDCFVLPSLSEGISNVILEAMATGLPVIATNVGGNADLVMDGQTGDLVPAADVEALAARMVQLCSDRQRAKQMGLAGRDRVERNFSLTSMVGKYQALYNEVLAGSSSVPSSAQ